MKYRKLLQLLWRLVLNPGQVWARLKNRTEDTQQDMSNFYTLLLAVVAVALLSGLVYGEKISFVSAFLKALITGATFFGGAWGAMYVLTEVLSKKFSFVTTKAQCIRVVLYTMFLPMVLNMLIDILPDLKFLRILLLYTVFIVWEAMGKIIVVDEKEQSSFVLWLSATIIFFPVIINALLAKVIFSSAL